MNNQIFGFVGIGLALVLVLITILSKKRKARIGFGIFSLIVGVVGLSVLVLPVLGVNLSSLGMGGNTLSIGEESGVQTPSGTTETGACTVDGFIKIDGKCQCLSSDKTTVTLAGRNAYTGAATGGAHSYAINGAPTKSIADSGTFTASPGDTIKILWENSSTTSAYLGEVSTEVVPCSGAKTFSKDLYANVTTFSIDVFNRDDNKMSISTYNQTMGLGDDFSLRVRLSGTYQTGFDNGGIIVLEYNKTAFDTIELTSGGVSLLTNTPGFYSAGPLRIAKAFNVPAVLSNTDVDSLKLRVKASGTTAPVAEQESGQVNMTFYPKNYFIDDTNGGAFSGPSVQDENNLQTYGYKVVQNIVFE